MVRELAMLGISDTAVLQSLEIVPRHAFLHSAFSELAYENKALPIGLDQTISHPLTVAKQSQLLQLHPGMKVLEVGTGSGYQTAVLFHMGVKVFSIERHMALHEQAKKILHTLHVKAHLTYGDGYKGLPTFGPFDRILITCATPFIPEDLQHQLKKGGRMVLPFGKDEEQNMLVIRKDEKGEYHAESHGKCAFVPMLQNKNPRNTQQ